VFDERGIDRNTGCVVIIRPDQYVAHVLKLDCRDALDDFFATFMIGNGPSLPGCVQ